MAAMGLTQAQIDRITSLANTYGASRLILFGSAVEAQEKARDIDLACDGVQGWKIFELAAKIEEELHMPLDLVPLTPPSRFTKHIESRCKVLL
jgi:predicted nucleotidyltransferase